MNDQVASLRTAIQNAFAARVESERAANTLNANKEKNLAKYLKEVDHDNVVAVLLACNYDVSAISQNVYAVEKQISTARFVASCDKLDIYTSAIVQSMHALESAEVEITRDVIASLCTNDVKTKYDAKIKTTRVQSAKSQSTVATQHNSSINALLALHMIKTARNAKNEETFTLDRENYAVKAIAERFEIAL